MERIEKCCHAFLVNIKSSVKPCAVQARVHVPFDLDVWRYLSKGKGKAAGRWLLFEKEDFVRFTTLPDNWYCLNEHGEGKVMDFPMK